MNKIALVSCYMGVFPNYFQLFLDSAAKNLDVDFYIFNNGSQSIKTSSNVKIISMSLEELNRIASSKLDLPINITPSYGYKLCDLKPAYGVIFEDYLTRYDFWGHCDIDVIWGRITHFLTPEKLANFDVLTFEETHFAGHLTLFRNSGVTIDLFRQTEDYKKVFTDNSRCHNFCECCYRWGKYHPLKELIDSSQTVSIYDIVMDLKGKQQLRLFIKYIMREYPDPFRFVYRDGVFEDCSSYLGLDDNSHGVFKDLNTKEEFMYFHLYHIKDDWRFYISQFDYLPSEFTVSSEGIIPGSPNNMFSIGKWKIQKALYSSAFLIRSLNELGVASFLKKGISKLHRRVTKGESLRLREICRTGSHFPS